MFEGSQCEGALAGEFTSLLDIMADNINDRALEWVRGVWL